MQKTIEYTVKREINSVDMTDNLCAYQEKLYIGNSDCICNEGITAKETLEKVGQDQKIKNSEIALYKKEILDCLRNSLLFDDYGKVNSYLITDPYSYFTEYGFSDVCLLNVSFPDHNIYSKEGKKYPKAIYFDYLDSGMDNEHYNLRTALATLKKRDDIVFIKDGIQDIPFYNAEPGCDKHLIFIWKPSDADFDKISEIESKYVMYNTIITKVFGIPRK